MSRNAIDQAVEELEAQKQYDVKRYSVRKDGSYKQGFTEDSRVYVIEGFFAIDAVSGIVAINQLRFKIKSYAGKNETKKKIRQIVDNRLKARQKVDFNKKQKTLF